MVLVLIETYWNVKSVFHFCVSRKCSVLIETYWNVKLEVEAGGTLTFSINRNILECKEMNSIRYTNVPDGINRNILECKGCFISWVRCLFFMY